MDRFNKKKMFCFIYDLYIEIGCLLLCRGSVNKVVKSFRDLIIEEKAVKSDTALASPDTAHLVSG